MSSPIDLSIHDREILVESLESLETSLTAFILQEEAWLSNNQASSKVRAEARALSAAKRQRLAEVAALADRIRAHKV